MSSHPARSLSSSDPVLAQFLVRADTQLELAESGLLHSRGKLGAAIEPVRQHLRRLAEEAHQLSLVRVVRTARVAIRLIDELADQRQPLSLVHENLLLDAVDDLRALLAANDLGDDDEDSTVTASITRRIVNLRQSPPNP